MKMESRSIREMKEGDFVKTADGNLHEIKNVEGNIPKNWDINTKDGLKVNMWNAHGYYKKKDLKDKE